MKTKHYFVFDKEVQNKFNNNSLNSENWEALRLDEEPGEFSIEKDIESYERNCMNAHKYRDAAKVVYELISSRGGGKTISLGVGKGILEWHLKKIDPQLVIECTDYTENALEQLKMVFKDMDAAYQFDILNGDYTELDRNSIFIMYRVSTEFSLEEWYKIFGSMYNAGITYIIFVPAGLCNVWDIAKEKIKHAINIILRKEDVFCGYLYSENEYMKMFKGNGIAPLYIIEKKVIFEETAAFLLKRLVKNDK